MLADDRADQETVLAERNERRPRLELVREAFGQLDRREREIVVERCLKDKSTTLGELDAATRFRASGSVRLRYAP